MTISGGFQLHFDAGCELQPTSPGAQHSSLDVCGHETLILSRARKKIKDDLAEMDPEVLSPHLQSHLESHADIEHLSAPMSQMEVPPHFKNKQQKTVATLFISPPGFLSSSSCHLCLVSGQERGRPRTGAQIQLSPT